MRAAIYARVSTQEQGEGYSIAGQLALSKEYAVRQGYSVLGEYVDVGYSGGTVDRPQLEQMLLDAERGRFDVVVSKNPDRLARGVEVFIPIQTMLQAAGCGIEFVEETYRDDPMSQAMLQIRQVMAGMERKMIGIRVHASRVQKAKEGKVNAHPKPLYGYDYDPDADAYVVNEEQAAVIRSVFQSYISGVKPRHIANQLNADGVPTKTHSRYGWDAGNLSELITQTAYYGEGWANRYTFVKGDKQAGRPGKVMQRPREEWVPVAYPPIISRETWEAAQAQRRRNKAQASHNRASAEYLLNGILWCGECGTRFMVRTIRPKGAGARVYRYYKCGGMIRYPHLHQCREGMLRAERVEDAVLADVGVALSDGAFLEQKLREQYGKVTAEARNAQEDIERVRRRLYDLDEEKGRYLTLYGKGKITEAAYDRKVTDVNKQMGPLLDELHRHLAMKEATLDIDRLVESAWAATIRYLGELAETPPSEYVRHMVSRVAVDGAGNITTALIIPDANYAKQSLPSLSSASPASARSAPQA